MLVNMVCFVLEVVDVVIVCIGVECIVLCVFLGVYFNIKVDLCDCEVFDYLLFELEKCNLVYLYEGMFDDSVIFDFLGG